MLLQALAKWSAFLAGVSASVNPIEVHGRFFIDSITKEPVCIFFNCCKLF